MSGDLRTSLLGKNVGTLDVNTCGTVVGVYVGTTGLCLVVQESDGNLFEKLASDCHVIVDEDDEEAAPDVIPDPLPKMWHIRSFEAMETGNQIEIKARIENPNNDVRELEETVECPTHVALLSYDEYFDDNQQSIVLTMRDEDDDGYEIQIELDMIAGCWDEDSLQLENWEKLEQ